MRASPCSSGYLFKCLLLCHLNLSSGGGVGTAQSTYAAPPSQRPALWESPGAHDTAMGAAWATLDAALARYGTTFRKRISKMVASGVSSQAPEGLSLQRELDFQFLQGSHFGTQFGSIWDPKMGLSASRWLPWGAILLNLSPYWERLSVRSRGSCAKSGHSWPQTCSKSYAHQFFAAFGALTWACSA